MNAGVGRKTREHRRVLLYVLSALVGAMALLALMPAGQAEARPTKLFTGDYQRSMFGLKQFEVRPPTISYTGDGTGFLGGKRRPGWRFGRLNWRFWKHGRAKATGKAWLNTCRPSCAEGKFRSHRATVKATKPRHGRFKKLKIRFRFHRSWYVDKRVLRRVGNFWAWAISPHAF